MWHRFQSGLTSPTQNSSRQTHAEDTLAATGALLPFASNSERGGTLAAEPKHLRAWAGLAEVGTCYRDGSLARSTTGDPGGFEVAGLTGSEDWCGGALCVPDLIIASTWEDLHS
jgi:hypothetical protein